MASILVVCHGRLGEALIESARMIVGSAGTAKALEFGAGMGTDELAAEIGAELAELQAAPGGGSGVVILTDLPGGTPARTAAVAASQHADSGSDLAVVAGVNLPMLVESLLADPDRSATDVGALAFKSGHAGVIDIGSRLHDQEASS